MITTAVPLAAGPHFYVAMGARRESLRAALNYSNLILGGAALIWLFNQTLSVLLGKQDSCGYLGGAQPRRAIFSTSRQLAVASQRVCSTSKIGFVDR
jgi:hypothetical protein